MTPAQQSAHEAAKLAIHAEYLKHGFFVSTQTVNTILDAYFVHMRPLIEAAALRRAAQLMRDRGYEDDADDILGLIPDPTRNDGGV